ncbi:hypothetical protein [uncultured Tenacibaculum sp.]|uniref:hypothetical protein n=1 Tax=uncultured Tenacibaculum sp. TaxID=174713 RepID=UPI00261A8125|nr:hypothetical protein [uncultured Tenacibaculum sp.]
MNKAQTNIKQENMDYSFRNAHVLTEFSQLLQNLGSEMEESASLFDKIQVKDEVFQKFESIMDNPFSTLIDFNNKTQKDIFEFVFSNFLETFSEHKDKFNFIHSTYNYKSFSELIFFISINNEEFQESLFNLEYDYAMSELSEIVNVSFCFLEKDMEEGLTNTQKIEFENA